MWRGSGSLSKAPSLFPTESCSNKSRHGEFLDLRVGIHVLEFGAVLKVWGAIGFFSVLLFRCCLQV